MIFKIYNSLGQIVMEGELLNGVHRLNVSVLAPGTYVFRMQNYAQKVVISR